MHFVYILKSLKTGRRYIGETRNLLKRLNRHNGGRSKATRFGIPWEVEIACEVKDKKEGCKLERELKNLKSPEKAIEYVRGHYKVVVETNSWLRTNTNEFSC